MCDGKKRAFLADGLVQCFNPVTTASDMMSLPEKTRTALHDLIRVFREWTASRKTHTSGPGQHQGITALFAGLGRTDKALAAQITANSLGRDLYRIDLGRVVSTYIGETEKNLEKLFDTAEKGDVILFFDEADPLFGRRTDIKDANDRYANRAVRFLSQRLEAFRGLSIIAVNEKANLDPAFLRRLRFVVDFPLPDEDVRTDPWRENLPGDRQKVKK